MSSRVHPGNDLQPPGEYLHRIKHTGDGLEQEHHTPSQDFSFLAKSHDEGSGQYPDNPSRHHEIQDERNQPHPDHEDVVGVEQASADNHDHRNSQYFEDAHDHRGGEKLTRLERTGKQVHEISRPNLLQERNRNPLLRSEQHIPQNQRSQKKRHGPRDLSLKFHEVDGNESPDDEVQKGPIEDFHHTGQAAPVQVQMPRHQRIDSMNLHPSSFPHSQV